MKRKLSQFLRLTFLTFLWFPTLGILRPISGLAQVVPDGTLNTIVSPATPDPESNNVFTIQGGTSAGNNLFHSFDRFSLPTGTGAFFDNALEIRNIFSRVTGGELSNIDGFIRANGAANLFLLNPSGIVFGPNASLDLGGSFLATSADSIVFEDGSFFSATNTGGQPLLTVSVPVGLQFGTQPGDIVNQAGAIPFPGGPGAPLGAPPPDAMQPGAIPPGAIPPDGAIPPGAIPPDGAIPPGAIPPGTVPPGGPTEGLEPGMPSGAPPPPPNGLRVERGRSLALVGGNVFLPGGALTGEQGRIELGAVGDNSLVNLALTPAGFALDYSGVENFRDIQLSQAALVNVNGPGAGFVQVQGAEVELTQGSQIIANTLADLDGGGITVRASESLDLISGGPPRGPSGLLAQTVGTGAGGSIDISTKRLTVVEGAQVSAQVTPTGSGTGGSITVNASESVEAIGIAPNGVRATLAATTLGFGDGGDLTITTGELRASNGARITSATGGQSPNVGAGAMAPGMPGVPPTENTGNPNMGDPQQPIQPPPNADPAAMAPGMPGVPPTENTGNPNMGNPQQPIQPPANADPGAMALNTGNAGNLTINANRLIVRNEAQVLASTFGNGKAGDIDIITSESVELIEGRIIAQVEPGATGDGGSLTIQTPRLRAERGGQVSTGTLGSGNGGDLRISASESVQVIGASSENPSALLAGTQGDGNAGNLTIDTGQLIIREGQVRADTTMGGRGGNLTVNATSVEVSGQFPGAPEPAVLSVATSGSGDGGDLEINTQRLTIREGARVSARTGGEGRGGTLTVEADESVEVIGEGSILSAGSLNPESNGEIPSPRARLNIEAGSEISSPTLQQEGMTVSPPETDNNRPPRSAGNLNIATGRLTVRDGAEVSVSGEGTGVAGNLTVNATDEIRLENGSIEAETETNPADSSESANIGITTSDLFLDNGSEITAEASGTANGGNVQIRTGNLVAGDDSDISANAVGGNGGNIQIDTSADIRSFNSSITASSARGIDGVVDINRPEIDPASGLVELEEDPVDPESLIARGCNADEQSSRFVNTGLGGVPQGPGDAQGSDAFWEDIRPVNSGGESSAPSSLSAIASNNTQPIVEARGWHFNEKGQIVLTAEPGQGGGQASRLSYGAMAGCDGIAHSSGSYPKEQQERSPANLPKQIAVRQFQVLGSTVFEPEEFAAVLEPFADRPLSFEELLEARQAVTELYAKSGYITSGVYIPPQTVADGKVELQAQENGLEGIRVSSVDVDGDRQLENYVKSRLERATLSRAVNTEEIVEALRLLQLEGDLIETISAELVAGSGPRQSVLDVKVEGKRPYGAEFSLDNRRSPSVGSLRGAANLHHANFLGLGDRLDLSYSRTDGSNTLEFDYAVPINSSNTTLGFRFSNADSDIVEPPFDRLDIDANSRNYELTLRQPLIQRATNKFTREFALGLTASRRESETSLLGERFPLSAGANNNGETRISALRFFQEWTQQEDKQVFALRSQFSLGLGAFDATINNDEPDSRFFAWRGQGQWARRLGSSGLLLLRTDLQLATTSLVPFEQFGVGGFDSVRGYRQDARLKDNGAFASVEARFPIPGLSGTGSELQIIPFLDAGTGWNNDREDPKDKSLVSAGLGLRYTFNDLIDARLDFGIPLVDIDSRDRTWQENGIYFSIKVNPF